MPIPYILAFVAIAFIILKTKLWVYEDNASRWKSSEFFASSRAEVNPVKAPRFGWVAGFWEGAGRNIADQPMSRSAAVWRPPRVWAAAAAQKRVGS